MSSAYAPIAGREKYMSAFDPNKCAAGVWTNGRAATLYQCNRKAVLQEDGHGWCKQHAPSTEQAKKSVLQTKWKTEDLAQAHKQAVLAARARVVEAAQMWYARELGTPHRSMQWPDALEMALIELEHLEAEAQP